MFSNQDEVLRYLRDNEVEFVDARFCDLPGIMQHFTLPGRRTSARFRLRGRPALRRLVDPGLPGHPRVGHAPAARPVHGVPGSVPPAQDAEHELLHPRPADARVLQPRPAQHRAEGRAVPGRHGRRGHVLLRARGRVLHLRRRSLRLPAQRLVPPGRLDRGAWNSGRTRSRGATLATSRATRAATSRCRRPTTSPTCARRWSRS